MSTIDLQNSNEAQRAAAVSYLRTLAPGTIPKDIFEALMNLMVVCTVEMVPIRVSGNGKLQVLLTQRPDDDPIWPGDWHVPGVVLRITDSLSAPHDFNDAFSRIFGGNGELKDGVQLVSAPVYFDAERRQTRRGQEFSALHYVEVSGEPAVGQFFDIEEFPTNVPAPGVIEHHVNLITKAVARYRADKQRIEE